MQIDNSELRTSIVRILFSSKTQQQNFGHSKEGSFEHSGILRHCATQTECAKSLQCKHANYMISFIRHLLMSSLVAGALWISWSLVQVSTSSRAYRLYLDIVSFKPETGFLSDLVTFYTAVAGIFMPVTLHIVTQIADRLGSDILAKQFTRQPLVKYLPILLFANIGMVVVARYTNICANKTAGPAISYFFLLLFLSSIVLIYLYTRKLILMLDSDAILKSLQLQATCALDKIRADKIAKARFIENLSAIGDVLVVETKRQNVDRVLKTFTFVQSLFSKLLQYRTAEPEKFDLMIISDEILELSEREPMEAAWAAYARPEKTLLTFSTFVSIFARSHEAAVVANCEKIKDWSVANTASQLRELFEIEKMNQYSDYLISQLSLFLRKATERKDTRTEVKVLHWYRDAFLINDRSLVEYGNHAAIRYFGQLQLLVDNERIEAIGSSIEYFLGATYEPELHLVWDFGHLLLRSDYELYKQLQEKEDIEGQLGELSRTQINFYSPKEINEFLKRFEELELELKPHLDAQSLVKAQEIKLRLLNSINCSYKSNLSLEVFFWLGSYALYRKQIGIILRLWETNQPLDTNVHWVGQDITPTSVFTLLKLFYSKTNLDREFMLLWDGHHGASFYLDEYFVLCVAHLITRSQQPVNPTNTRADPKQFTNQLLKRYVETYPDLLLALDRVKEQNSLLEELRLKNSNFENIFNENLPSLLSNIKADFETELSDRFTRCTLDSKRVESFRNACAVEFSQRASFRRFFSQNQKLVYRTRHRASLERSSGLGIQTTSQKCLLPKEMFTDWPVRQIESFGIEYGRAMAEVQNHFFLENLLPNSRLSSIKHLTELADGGAELVAFTSEEGADKLDLNGIVVSTNKALSDANLEECTYIHIERYKIPLFLIQDELLNDSLLVLDKKTAGYFVQYTDRNGNSDEDNRLQTEILDFESNPELLEKTVSDEVNSRKKLIALN
jgi:hypothetical protein